MDLNSYSKLAQRGVTASWDEARLARSDRRVRRAIRRRRPLRRATGTAFVVLLLFSGLYLARRLEKMPELKMDPNTVALMDGSTAIRLTGTTRLETVEDTTKQTTLRLQRGNVRFNVQHNPRRVFRVECDTVTIEVLGTVFDIERPSPLGEVHVAVFEGLVHVSGPEGNKVLKAGESASVAAEILEPTPVEPNSGFRNNSRTRPTTVTSDRQR